MHATLTLALACGLAAAQDAAAPAAPPSPTAPTGAADSAPDLEELARRIDAAHRTAEAAPVTAFAADLRIQEISREADQHRAQFELSVKFLEWQNPDTGRPWPLIRYRQADGSRDVEQGRDRQDYWSRTDGRVQDMRAREFETDLAHCRRNLKLARQMIRFVDPAAVLRGLRDPEPVLADELQQGRTTPVPVWRVRGRLDAFPLRQYSGDDLPVRATVFVERDSNRLVGLEVLPIGAADEPAPAAGEFLRFLDHRLIRGRLVPMRIVHSAVEPDGRRLAQMTIEITTLDLDAQLTATDFDR
ncbi:MAG: hypothetical protein AB7O97_22600 [Planctomycetota bacterium]